MSYTNLPRRATANVTLASRFSASKGKVECFARVQIDADEMMYLSYHVRMLLPDGELGEHITMEEKDDAEEVFNGMCERYEL